MHHLSRGISSLLHSINPILFTLLLVHLVLRVKPHHSHHLCCQHLSLRQPFNSSLSHILSSIVFVPVLDYVGTDLCFSFFFLYIILFLASCARLSLQHSVFQSMLISSILLYHSYVL